MTEPRPWPNNAAEIRDQAAEAACRGIRALRPLVMGETYTQAEIIRRQAVTLDALQTIRRLLETVGAQTKTRL